MRHAPASRQTRCSSTRGTNAISGDHEASPRGQQSMRGRELPLMNSLSCREAAELPLELNPAQPIPQGREAPRQASACNASHANQSTGVNYIPRRCKQKLLLEIEFESMRLNEWRDPQAPNTRVAALDITHDRLAVRAWTARPRVILPDRLSWAAQAADRSEHRRVTISISGRN